MKDQMARCCGNCIEYDDPYCTLCWKHLDPAYCMPDRDYRKPTDVCDQWEYDEGLHEGEEA
jgi:hypothetical protein